jgi:hypothetical protein
MRVLDYSLFGNITVLLQSKNVTFETLPLVDLGDIHLTCEGRSYQLDYFELGRTLLDDGQIELTATRGNLDRAKTCFEDCAFDLQFDDLSHPKLRTTVFVGSDEDKIDLTFISGFIEVDLGTTTPSTLTIHTAYQ